MFIRRAVSLFAQASTKPRVFTAGFADAAKSSETFSPNINIPGVAGTQGRYAKALYAAAIKANNVDQVSQELKTVVSLASQSKQFAQFLDDPTIPRTEKKAKITSFLTNAKYAPLTTEFFGLLADNGRLNETGKVADAFDKIYSNQRGEVQAVVTSASEPSAAQIQRLTKALQNQLKAGQKLQIKTVVDPKIIAGFKVDMGEKHFDLSVLGRIQTLRRIADERI